jgi:hypothetical protein
MHRFKHYTRNVGGRSTLINLLILGYLLYLLFGRGFDPVMLVITFVMVACALLPRLFLKTLVANPARTVRVLNIGTFVIIAVFLLNFAQVWAPPVQIALAIPPVVGLLIGANFWLFSDPRVLTNQGMAYYTDHLNTGHDPMKTHA